MKRFCKFIWYSLLIAAQTSCTDIFEPSIEDEKVSVISPADGVSSPTYQVLFWWNPLNDALRYRIQIVRPDFSEVNELLLDTLVTSSKFLYHFSPGNYQWRIRAENGSTQTAYVTRTLKVDTTSLSGQPFTVSKPIDSTYSKLSIRFQWPEIYGATSYILEVDPFPGNFTNPSTYILNVPTPYNWYQYDFPQSGTFSWHVKAINSSQESTAYSEPRTVIIYKTPPSKATDLRSASSGINRVLSWTPPSSTNSIKSYKIYIHEIPLTIPIGTDTSSYPIATTPIPVETVNAFYSFPGTTGKRYAWRVIAVDKALNESDYSYFNVFTK